MTTTLESQKVDVLPEVRAFSQGTKRMLIDGESVEAVNGATFPTLDPATGEKIADIAEAGPEDLDRAVSAARRALEGPWSELPATERGRLIGRLADLVEEHADELAQIESLDNGKPVVFAKAADLALAIDQLRYFSGWPSKIAGETLPPSLPDMHLYTRREPVGVVAAIVPWNFPLTLATWKVAPALAAGCTLILKPAEETPLTALRLGELALEAGIPPGVLNVCPGFGDTTGDMLVRHQGVNKIAFTGSTEVGKLIARIAADSLKQVTLELGGKSPNIIFADADLEAAAATAAEAIFFNSGQVCSAGSRMMVERSVYDQVVDAVAQVASKLQLGPGLDPETTLGPLVSDEQLRRVTSYLERGVEEGASVAVGGRRADGDLASGYFVEPTVLVDVTDDTVICREEIFGPVLVAQPFDSLEELAARANASSYGLAAGIWTTDVRKAHKFAAMLEAGTVWINCFNNFDAVAPFGGYKQSGYGRDNGRAALDGYLQTKTVWTNLA
ncbi:MAG: aldehyde dehydrogenase family protein [Solirubrobacterales bacterium]